MHEASGAMPALMISCALPIHTSVPWDRPEMRISSSIVVGCVSSSIWRTNFVPNSGTPYVPVLEPICSGVTPSACVPENSEITSGSVSGRVRASTPVKSISMRIIVGSSCPRTSSFTRTSCIEPKS